jgi:hypothetical protein
VALAAAVLALSGCAMEEGRPPVARIAPMPSLIPAHDNFRTDVVLDGSASADPFDDPEGTAPLAYAWTIEGDEHRYEAGGADAVAPVVRLRGNRPATLRLVVTDGDGLSGSAAVQLQLTVSE